MTGRTFDDRDRSADLDKVVLLYLDNICLGNGGDDDGYLVWGQHDAQCPFGNSGYEAIGADILKGIGFRKDAYDEYAMKCYSDEALEYAHDLYKDLREHMTARWKEMMQREVNHV